MRFVQQYWLLLWCLLPVLGALAVWARRRQKQRAQRFADMGTFPKLAVAPSVSRIFWASALPLMAILLLAVAMARPQAGTRKSEVEREGAAVAIVLDTSLSMATEDETPSRFRLARRAIEYLLDHLTGDKLALVAFAGRAYLLSPMTADYRALSLMLDGVRPGIVGEPGSSIAAGLAGGLEALKSAEEGMGKAIVLISDGEDWSGELSAAAEEIDAAGVKLLVLGVGLPSGEPIPIRAPDGDLISYKKSLQGEVVFSKANDEALRELATEAGGAYWHLSGSMREAGDVRAAIEKLSRQAFAQESLYRYTEKYQWALLPALLLLWLELLLPWQPRQRRQSQPANGSLASSPAGAMLLVLCWLLLSGFDWQSYRNTQKGIGAFSREEYERAYSHFEKALEAAPEGTPEAAALHYNLGTAYYKQGRYDDALAEWGRAAKIADDAELNSALSYNSGNAELSKAMKGMESGAPDQEAMKRALQNYRRSLELDPDAVAAKHNYELATKLLEVQPPPPQQSEAKQGDENKDSDEEQQSQNAQMQAGAEDQKKDGEKKDGQQGEQQQAQQKDQKNGGEQDEKREDSLADRSGQNGDEKKDDKEQQAASGQQGEKQEGEDQQSASAASQGAEHEQEGESRTAKEISREEAERILDALSQRESERAREQQAQLLQSRGDHDW